MLRRLAPPVLLVGLKSCAKGDTKKHFVSFNNVTQNSCFSIMD